MVEHSVGKVVEEFVVGEVEQHSGLMTMPLVPVVRSSGGDAGPSDMAGPSGSSITREEMDVQDDLDMASELRERVRESQEVDWTPDMEVGARAVGEVVTDAYEGLNEAGDMTAHRGQPSARVRASRVLGRGRGRGGRGGRGRGGRGGHGARHGTGEWQKGDRLIEVFSTDEDVPQELRNLLESLVRDRVERQRLTRERYARKETERRECSRSQRGRPVNVEANNSSDDENDGEVPIYQAFKQFAREEEARNFVWKPLGEGFRREKEAFLVENAGLTQHFDGGYQAFRQIWTDDILERIVSATNQYASSICQKDKNFHDSWYNTNKDEILILFAFWIMLGVIQMPTVDSCFSLNPLLNTTVFRMLLTRNRYWALNKTLRFANPMANDTDRLALIRPLIEHLNTVFQKLYVLGRNVCIDESLTLWKGLLRFRQYTKTKASKFGIKTYELCESSTGYLWAFFLYTGKDVTEDASILKSSKQVLRLVSPLLGKGHTLFMDNYFHAPLLARFLKRNGTDCVRTLRRSRQDVPPILSQRLKEGNFVARQADDVVVMAFQDKKPVTLISTYHDKSQHATVAKPDKPVQYKLDLVTEYNTSMGGVDLKDGMLQAHLIERKQCLRWFKKMAKRFLNVSIQNSRVLVEQSKGTKVKALNFRLELVWEIMGNHLKHVPKPVQSNTRQPRTVSNQMLNPLRYVCEWDNFHSLQKYAEEERPSTGGHKRTSRENCLYCKAVKKRYRKTPYECGVCGVPLCFDCFAEYHTEQ